MPDLAPFIAESPALPVYASFWRRAASSVIDSLLFWAIIMPLLVWVYGPEYGDLALKHWIAGPADFLISYMFPITATLAFWVYRQATPGKMLLSMKLVSLKTGGAPTWQEALIRFWASLLSAAVFGLGYLWVAFDPRRQAWHDKLAGTVVVVEPKQAARTGKTG